MLSESASLALQASIEMKRMVIFVALIARKHKCLGGIRSIGEALMAMYFVDQAESAI